LAQDAKLIGGKAMSPFLFALFHLSHDEIPRFMAYFWWYSSAG
jgi:hypothetical protein